MTSIDESKGERIREILAEENSKALVYDGMEML